MVPREQAEKLLPSLEALTPEQFTWVAHLVQSMALPVQCQRNPQSDIFPDDRAAGFLFLYLITHHSLSAEPFKKEKCEYALERIMNALGRTATLATSRTNPGHDLTVDGVRWSLKSEARRDIRRDSIFISKWMELGKGKWEEENDLRDLCQNRFQPHLTHYDRIFIFRCLTPADPVSHEYELVEAPMALFTNACSVGEFAMRQDSKQTPRPGYCWVRDRDGNLLYELYFNGGTERKLRVQKLRRDLCVFHAAWTFS